jgi:hypothetical protein
MFTTRVELEIDGNIRKAAALCLYKHHIMISYQLPRRTVAYMA